MHFRIFIAPPLCARGTRLGKLLFGEHTHREQQQQQQTDRQQKNGWWWWSRREIPGAFRPRSARLPLPLLRVAQIPRAGAREFHVGFPRARALDRPAIRGNESGFERVFSQNNAAFETRLLRKRNHGTLTRARRRDDRHVRDDR